MSGSELARYLSAPTVRLIRAHREEDEKELFDNKVDDSFKQLSQMLKVSAPCMSGVQRAKLINIIDKGHGYKITREEIGRLTFLEERNSRKGAEAERKAYREPPERPARGEALFPYQSQEIMERVKRLLTDVEIIRNQVMTPDNEIFTDELGRSTCSVRDLSSFVSAVHSLYTTVGNLESLDKVRGDLQSVTHAISEAALELPATYQDKFMAKFKEVIKRINER